MSARPSSQQSASQTFIKGRGLVKIRLQKLEDYIIYSSIKRIKLATSVYRLWLCGTHNMKSCSQLGVLPRTAIVVDLTFCSLSVTYV